MNASSKENDPDLQHLLPAEVRKTVAAVPIRSLNLGIFGFCLVFFAGGIALGGWIESGAVRSWLIGACVVVALGLGAVARRYEAALLRRLSHLSERGEALFDRDYSDEEKGDPS